MTRLPLFLLTYSRGTHPTTHTLQPYHWSYFIPTSRTDAHQAGIAHQLHGMPGGFYYLGAEHIDLKAAGPRKTQLEIGEIESSKLDDLCKMFKALPIETSESSGWNCQNWALSGLEELKRRGFVYDYITEDGVRNWLREY